MAGYGTDEGFAAWAAENGYTVPSGTVAAARQRGSVYIDGKYDGRFPGYPTGGAAQKRSWPRTGAEDRYGNAIASNAVPDRVVQASYEAALLELETAGSLSATTSEGERLKRLKAGSVELEYADSASFSAAESASPVSTRIEGLLYPLLIVSDPPAVAVV